MRVVLKDAILKHGQFPLWDPSKLAGMPTVDALFGDALYMPVLPLKLILPFWRDFPYKEIMHIILAGFLFYLLMIRGFRAAPPAAFLAAVFYMLNAQFVSHVYPGHDAKMYIIGLLPFTVWRMKVLMEKPDIFNTSLLAFIIGLTIMTGHVQLGYFVLWGLFFYWVMHNGLVMTGEYKANGGKIDFSRFGKNSILFWVAAIGGVAFAAVQIYPSFMFVRNEFSLRGVGRGFEYAASWSLHWPEIFGLWVPEFCNTFQYYWSENYFKLNYEYVGAVPMLLAVVAVAYKPVPWRIFWAGVAAFSLLFSLGAHTPVFHIAYYIIPGVQKFRACSMIMMWFSFSVVLLAALFLADVYKENFVRDFTEKKKNIKTLYILGALSLALTLLFSMQGAGQGAMNLLGVETLGNPEKFRIFEANYGKNFVPALWLWLLWSLGTLSLLFGVVKGAVPKKVFIAGLLVIGLVDIIRIDMLFIKPVPSRPHVYEDPAFSPLRQEMVKAPFRVFALPGAFRHENNAAVFGMEELSGFSDNEMRWYSEFRGERNNANYFIGLIGGDANRQYLSLPGVRQGNPFLNIANAKYILTRDGSGKLVPLENENALGRISFVPSYIVMSEEQIVPSLRAGAYDYRRGVALLEKPVSGVPYGELNDSVIVNSVSAVWEKYTPNYRKAVIKSPADGFLRISEVYYPGWKITIDGKEVKTYRADKTWIAVEISRGRHEIIMEPQSLYFGIALRVTLAILLIIVGIWGYTFVSIMRKRKQV